MNADAELVARRVGDERVQHAGSWVEENDFVWSRFWAREADFQGRVVDSVAVFGQDFDEWARSCDD